jgi:serine protease Do
MNTAIATGRGGALGQGQFAGIGLAIPMDIIENVVGQIIEKGEVEKGFVGVGVLPVNAIAGAQVRDPAFRCVAQHFDGQGAVINRISPDSPAELAGLQVGDVITAIDGTKITDSSRVPALIGTRRPGQVVRFDVWRPIPAESRGEMREIEVALVRRAPESDAGEFAMLLRELGMARMATASKESCAAANVPYVRGVLLEDVAEGSAAAGVLPEGAVIVAVEGQSVGNLEEFYVRVRRLVNPTQRTMRPALVLTVALPQGGYRDVEVPLR